MPKLSSPLGLGIGGLIAVVLVGIVTFSASTILLPAENGGLATSAVQSSPEPSPTPSSPEVGTLVPEDGPTPSEKSKIPTPVALSVCGVVTRAPVYGYTDAMVKETKGEVVPSTLDNVAYWSGGGRPGATRANTDAPSPELFYFTTFLYGHSWIHDAVFNELRKESSVPIGCTVILWMSDGGKYTYQTTDRLDPIEKGHLFEDLDVNNDTVGRLVLISCYRPDGYPDGLATTQNIVVIAQLLYYTPPNLQFAPKSI